MQIASINGAKKGKKKKGKREVNETTCPWRGGGEKTIRPSLFQRITKRGRKTNRLTFKKGKRKKETKLSALDPEGQHPPKKGKLKIVQT